MRLLRILPQKMCVLCWLALTMMLAGCGANSPKTPPTKPDQTGGDNKDFREDPLRIGDRITVELSGIPDIILPNTTDIKDDGSINMPYIGRITAAGKSPSQLEQEITALYVPHWYTHIGVTVTPLIRYFFVGGQVMGAGGGRIQYTGPITLLGAIQAAGDFNPFANRRNVQVTRANGTILHVNCIKAIKRPDLDIPIYPGDRIFVKRRF
jgi:protein involved in polysaccharide export with SLBB domain